MKKKELFEALRTKEKKPENPQADKAEIEAAVEKARMEERAFAEESGRVNRMVESQMREINALNPSIRSIGDIMQMETAEEFREYVGRGLSFVEAYKLANFENIRAEDQMRSKRDAFNLMRSKGHLQPTVSRGAGAVNVPEEEMEMYKELNPGMSEAEILKHYNAYKKR